MSALGQLLNNVAIAAGILTKKCIIAIITICNPAAESKVAPVPILSRIRIERDAIKEAILNDSYLTTDKLDVAFNRLIDEVAE